MAILKKLQNIPSISKFLFNHYPPYRGAGIHIEVMNLEALSCSGKNATYLEKSKSGRHSLWRKPLFNG